MSTETDTAETGIDLGRLGSGAAGGLIGAVVFGLLVELALTDLTVAMGVPGLYGVEGPLPVAGWGIHLFNGALLGLVYVAAVQYGRLGELAHSYRGVPILGVAYGVVLTFVVAAVVAPFWLGVGGDLFQLPTITRCVVATTVLGHVLFATVVAITYATYVNRYDSETDPGEVTP